MQETVAYTSALEVITITSADVYNLTAIGANCGSAQGADERPTALGRLDAPLGGEIYLQAASMLKTAVGSAGGNGASDFDVALDDNLSGGGSSFVTLENDGRFIGGESHVAAHAAKTAAGLSSSIGSSSGFAVLSEEPPPHQDLVRGFEIVPGFQGGENLFTGGSGGSITGTITGISMDGINFLPPGSTITGAHTNLTVQDDVAEINAEPNGQAVVDEIHANFDSVTPLSDTYYYVVSNNSGSVVDSLTLNLNDVFFTSSPNIFPGDAESVIIGEATTINFIAVDTELATGETTDANESLTVTISLQAITAGASAALSINLADASAGHGGTIVSPTDSSVIISGSIGQINADLAGLTVTGIKSGNLYLVAQAVEGPAITDPTDVGRIDVVECFLAGTRIRTPQGEVAVQDLRAGDLVATLHSGPQPIMAVQRLGFTSAAQFRSAQVRPIRIAAGALGPNTPSRDLYVSPDHAMFLDGALVPAKLLLNGSSITQPARHAAITYIHIELAPHGIIFAEDAATETYLDIGKGAAITSLDPFEPKSWEDACAPLLLAGPALAAIRARLATQAARVFAPARQVPNAA